MAVQRANYAAWLLKLVGWDGMLPVCVLLTPTVIEILFPNRRGLADFTAVTFPVSAFILRLFIGKRHIDSNRCSPVVRGFQLGALCMGILVLLLIDTLVILALELPKGALFATALDRGLWIFLGAIYLASMAVAMYPGRTPSSAIEWRDFDPFTYGDVDDA